MPLDLLLRSNLVQQELSRMNINILSLLDKTVQVTPKVMRMLGGMLEREVTKDDPEWAAAMAPLTVSEKVKIMPSIRQHKDNERDCRTIVQQLVSSIPREVLTSTSYKWNEQGNGIQKKTVTFDDQQKEGEEVGRILEQVSLSRETNGKEKGRVQDQDLENKILSGEFRWMSRTRRTDPGEGADSVTHSSTDDHSRNSEIDTFSDRNSSSGS